MDNEPSTAVDRSRLLGQDYWLILSTPAPDTDQAEIEARVDDHLGWLLQLERDGVLFASGPLLSGPGTRPGSGVTVLRAPDEESADSRRRSLRPGRTAYVRRTPVAAQRGQRLDPDVVGHRHIRVELARCQAWRRPG